MKTCQVYRGEHVFGIWRLTARTKKPTKEYASCRRPNIVVVHWAKTVVGSIYGLSKKRVRPKLLVSLLITNDPPIGWLGGATSYGQLHVSGCIGPNHKVAYRSRDKVRTARL